jgi:hypothetical protein
MFPNVRLMIAATLASVVVLICGFGMFAVFRVSHDPFVHLPAATAPLQLVADNAARSSAGFASKEPFDRRFEVKALAYAAEDVNAAAAAAEPRIATETAAAAPPSAATPEETPSTAAEPMDQPSASVAPPTSEAPAVNAADAAASGQANLASEPQPETMPPISTGDAGAAARSADKTSPDAMAAEPDQEGKLPFVAVPGAERPPTMPVEVATNEPQDEPPPPRKRANLAADPAAAGKQSDGRGHKIAVKKPKRIRVAVRIRRVQRVATAQYPQARYLPTTEQNFGAAQPNFQTAPPSQSQFLVRRAILVRQSRIASRKPTQPNAATGGPFVSATSR